MALGLHQSEIDRLKAERCGEDDYLGALREWAGSEEDIKIQLNDMRQTQNKTQQTVQKSHEALQENKSKLERVLHIGKNIQQVFTELHQSQLNTGQGLSQAQTKMQETVQGNKSKLEEVHQAVTEIRQSQLNTNQEEEILKKLAKVDTQNSIRHHSERYLEGNRKSIFAKVTNWLDDRSSPSRVMVIIGNAGMGKSVIAAEMCKKMQEDGRLSGSHFCQHNKARHRNPKVMLQSLACHLSSSLPEYKKALVEKLSRNLGLEINDMEVGDLFELLFEEPLSRLSDPGFTSLVVIDALDESEYQGRNEVLDVISKYFDKLPLWIRFLVTTRPEINIWDSLKSLQPLRLEPNNEENLKDIRQIFEQRLSHVLQDDNLELIVKELVQKSEGLMLWAQLLVDFIKENFPILTLEHLGSTVPSGISSVYHTYFKRLETELCKELKISEDQFLSLLGVIAAARNPLPLGFVSKLFFPSTLSSTVQRNVNKAIACISSLLPVHDDCIHFFHKSVKDWLVDKSHYGQHNYSVDEHEGHRVLSGLCTDEFDEIKRKGVDSSRQLSNTTKYALQHGVQHMLELDEGKRPCSLEEIIQKYVVDVELVYAKLCVDVTAASEDIVCVNKFCAVKHSVLASFLFLLRKHSRELKELPHVIFQTLLNEGGSELCSEASNLLETKYSDITYMEYLHKNDLQESVQTTFYCLSQVACFDVSPRSDFMVCECRDGTIQLWSLHTGKLIWKRPVIEGQEKRYSPYFQAFRTSAPASFSPHFLSLPLSQLCTFSLSCFRSVVFHPAKDVILPGVLSHAYTFNGYLNRLFPGSDCSFSVCSISGGKILTDCPNDAKCLILWSLENGEEIARTTRNEDVLTFAWSRDEGLLAISHSTGLICLVDAMNDFQTLAETTIPNVCGMIKFTPDHRFLYCWHCPLRGQNPHFFRANVNVENHRNVSLDVESDENVCYEPWELELRSEGGFMFGDPLCRRNGISFVWLGSFVFVLNKQSILSSIPRSDSIEMLSPDELTTGSDGGKPAVRGLLFSVNGETVYHASEVSITASNIASGKLMVKSNTFCSSENSFLAVREGILFTVTDETKLPDNAIRFNGYRVELWNFGLSKCIRRWNAGLLSSESKLTSISDKCVVLESFGGNQVIILDTLSGDMTKIQFPGQFIACNSKCQLIITSDSHPHSVVLWQDQTVLWKKYWPSSGYSTSFSVTGIFSPADQFFVISGEGQGLYVLDGFSGKTLHLLWKGNPGDCKFVSDEECVIHAYEAPSGNCLRLFNVRSGQQLSVLDIDSRACCLASCPGKGLVAFCLMHSKLKFRVVQVKMPGKNKDGKKNKRSAVTLFTDRLKIS